MTTILNIRGTSGSGKSTIARQIMSLYGPGKSTYYIEGRKQPLGYRFRNHPGKVIYWQEESSKYRDLAVVGHYETDCGGADTIPDYDQLMSLVRDSANQGHDVLFEGLLFSGDVKHTIALNEWCHHNGHVLHVVAMQMDLELCVQSINDRRNAKAERLNRSPKPPVNPKNTIAKHKGLTLASSRLELAGVTVHRPLGREATFQLCKHILRLP